MVPGAERKLREHQHLASSEYLIRHTGHASMQHSSSKYPLASPNYHSTRTLQYDHAQTPLVGICTVNNRKCDSMGKELDGCDGPLLLNQTTAPDICTSNNENLTGYSSEKVDSLHVTSSVVIPGLIEQDFTGPLHQSTFQTAPGQASSPQHQQKFAGQTIPIKIKKGSNNLPNQHNHHQPFACYAEHLQMSSNRYGTLPSNNKAAAGGREHSSNIVHQGIVGVCDMGSSSSSSSYCSKSKTLQHPSRHHNKKSVTIGTFSTMDTSCYPMDKQQQQRSNNTLGYSGSAV